MLWPNTSRTRAVWHDRAGGTAHAFLNLPRAGGRLSIFTEWPQKASIPEGAAPQGAHTWPITAGGMSARSFPSLTTAANLLKGGPMDAAGAMGLTPDAPSMALIVSMAASWTAALTPAAPVLAMTIGMSAPGALSLTGAAHLALFVPLGSATGSMALSGASDLRGFLSMSASWGGAEPLSPQGLANAVWQRAIEAGYTAEQILRLLAAVAAGNASGLDANPAFTGIDGSTTRVAGTRSGGDRTITTRNGA